MNAQKGQVVDHISHDKLDNRRSNLRICTQAENQRNRRGPQSNNKSSGVLGVRRNTRLNKWESYIKINRKNLYLGLFDILGDAIKARRQAELKYFGEFAGTSNA